MKDAMEMLGAIPRIRAELDALPPDFMMRFIGLQLLKGLLARAFELGPPPDLAQKLGCTPAQAATIYSAVLRAAIARNDDERTKVPEPASGS